MCCGRALAPCPGSLTGIDADDCEPSLPKCTPPTPLPLMGDGHPVRLHFGGGRIPEMRIRTLSHRAGMLLRMNDLQQSSLGNPPGAAPEAAPRTYLYPRSPPRPCSICHHFARMVSGGTAGLCLRDVRQGRTCLHGSRADGCAFRERKPAADNEPDWVSAREASPLRPALSVCSPDGPAGLVN